MCWIDQLQPYLPATVSDILRRCEPELRANATEVRLGADVPLQLYCGPRRYFLLPGGEAQPAAQGSYCCDAQQCNSFFLRACGYSPYLHAAALRENYLTLPGGFRVGITGLSGSGIPTLQIQKAAFHIRIPHDIRGIAAEQARAMTRGGLVHSTLFYAPPGCGKTTLLRDLARQLDVMGYRVCVVDERDELSGYDLGQGTLVLQGVPKRAAMLRALRVFNPQVLLCDELAEVQDMETVRRVRGCGVAVAASAHADTREEVHMRFGAAAGDAFERFVRLADPFLP